MKKYIQYILLLIVGIVIGWLLFGGKTKERGNHEHATENSDKKQFWTCSMHPQIMQPEPGDCPICGMDLIPAEAGADGLAADQFKMTKNALALADIQTTMIGVLDIANGSSTLSGKIVENEATNSVQASYFSGRIESLKVNFTGEKVVKGQLLATIYAPELVKAQQELLTAATLKESQPALYKAVRNKLKLWKLSENQINQIESSKQVKEYFPVYATVSGTVLEKLVEVGDYVKQGQALFKIANLNSVWANFDVYESQIASFKVGQEIQISSSAYPGETFKAKISFIDPVVNTQTRIVTMRAVIDNSKQKFKPGMFIYGKVKNSSSEKNEEVVIPASAVLWTGKRSIVYVKPKAEEPVFEMREVVLGNQRGDTYEIKKGLSSGEEIVTNGVFTVDASAQLQGKKSMMNHTKSIQETYIIPNAFKEQLQNAYNSYIAIKNALIETNGEKAKGQATQFISEIKKINMELLSNEKAHKEWMSLLKTLKSSSEAIARVTDVEQQRKQFKIVSNHLILAVEIFGIQETAYKQYCPMADSDKGAYWLSKEKQVLNPYFGDKMLKCGEVKQVINNKQ
ncbi:efflux RND transporter periplasmic adaptor subunit [Tenacibaculum sp. TC6]|uniref:efflux RND transporter periplasmic adaptor subunit n=1 Tax=Tenacibaculum sp. TC6 TaxID=3423223 RepID=UPI003D35E99E